MHLTSSYFISSLFKFLSIFHFFHLDIEHQQKKNDNDVAIDSCSSQSPEDSQLEQVYLVPQLLLFSFVQLFTITIVLLYPISPSTDEYSILSCTQILFYFQIEKLQSPSSFSLSPITISQMSSPPAPAVSSLPLEQVADDFNAPPRKGKRKLKP